MSALTPASLRTPDFLRIREDFPALKQEMNGMPLVYLDSSATSLKPRVVIDATADVYTRLCANVHRGAYQLSQQTTDAFEAVRGKVAHFIGAQKFHEIVFTSGTTASINLVASSFGPSHLKPWNEVLVSRMEHHSNFIPWQQLALKTGAKFRIVELTSDFEIDLDAFKQALATKPKIVALTLTSNVLGTRNPIREMATAAKEAGALVIVDAAQGVMHERISISELGPIDFLAFSAHKLCGPTGVGVLWGREESWKLLSPIEFGGSMILNVQDSQSQWNDLPWRFEAGTPNIAGVIGFGVALDYLENIGIERIAARITELTQYALGSLKKIPQIRILGPQTSTQGRGPAISFVLEGVHPHDLATFLDVRGIAIRAGHHCAQPLMTRLNLAASARASLSFYNSESDVDTLVKALEEAHQYFAVPRKPSLSRSGVGPNREATL